MNNLIADISLGDIRGIGDLGLEGDAGPYFNLGTALVNFSNIFSIVIGVITIVAALWFIIKFFIGAIGILGSGGDKAKVAKARSEITYGLIGLVLVISAVFLINIIGLILHIDILDPARLISTMRSRIGI